MNKITLCLVSALAAIAVATPSARAATFGDWLAYCAGGSADVDKTIKTDSMAACGVQEGIKAACSVLSDTPWTCSMPSAMPKAKGEACDELDINFTIGASFAMPVGWKVAGDASATYSRFSAKTNINVCNTSPVIPTPAANGGSYSAESGDITFNVTMKIMGMLSVTNPLGITVNLNAAASCTRSTTSHYFKKADINSCGSPTPTPSPTAPPATPTPGGTPSSTPPPATPTPSGTPSSTPPPSTPTPSATASSF
ncbi:MAG TPA: hypothetical protein VF469_00010 [Kofleriaceae bacterium]